MHFVVCPDNLPVAVDEDGRVVGVGAVCFSILAEYLPFGGWLAPMRAIDSHEKRCVEVARHGF